MHIAEIWKNRSSTRCVILYFRSYVNESTLNPTVSVKLKNATESNEIIHFYLA